MGLELKTIDPLFNHPNVYKYGTNTAYMERLCSG